MKTIDLKKYYSNPELYGENNIVLVTDEVAEVLEQSLRDEKSFYMRRYRAKAYYSLDYGNGIENYLLYHEKSPEEIYEEKLSKQQLDRVLSTLPRKQGQHIFARYFLEKSCKEIASAQHITIRTVQISLQRGSERLRKLLRKRY